MTTARASRRTTVRVLSLETGGCGACAQSIAALLAPRYAATLRTQGISFVRSPRHADIVLVSGALTTAARAAAQTVINGVPHPRALVAVGDCALSGCVFSGSPYLAASAAETLDVNVEIGGCPPAPEKVLAAIAEAAQVLASEDEPAMAADDEAPESADDDADDDGEAKTEEGHNA